MYFWRIESLKEELRRGSLPQRSAFAYLLATFLLVELFLGVPGLWNLEAADITGWSWVAFAVTTILLIVGMYAAYKANGGSKGEDFAARYVALGWVLGLRIVVLSLAALFLGLLSLIVIGIVQGLVTPTDDLVDKIFPPWASDVFSVAVTAFFYWRLVHHFRSLAAPTPTHAADAPPAA